MKTKQIIEVVKKSLKAKNINEKSSSSNTPQWDSLGHLSILANLDKISKGKSSKINLSDADSISKLEKLLKKI
jgi:acyl carrier protein